MNREEIQTILPHRASMLLLDEAYLDEAGDARGRLLITGREFFLDGHFPGNPVVPGVIQCEIIAQTACMLLQNEMRGATPLYAGIDKARFRRMVKPGETIETSCRLLRQKLNVYVVAGEARVDGALCASGEFTFILSKG